jgi:hypothetical protein
MDTVLDWIYPGTIVRSRSKNSTAVLEFTDVLVHRCIRIVGKDCRSLYNSTGTNTGTGIAPCNTKTGVIYFTAV